MEPKRTLHSGASAQEIENFLWRNRSIWNQELVLLEKIFSSQDRRWMGRRKITKEGQEIFDLKPLTEEEIAWLEEHFMDFAREQYLVRQDDMREALKIAQRIIEIELKRDVGK